MTQLTTVTLLDDLDGSKAAETVAFGVDGIFYEIDLNIENARALRKALAEFTEAARPVSPTKSASLIQRGQGRVSQTRDTRKVATAIRAWASEQGIQVSRRGRISADVLARYERATQV